MDKILYFDVETTGLNPVKNDIIQFAGIIELDGVVKDTINLKIKPFDFTTIQIDALQINGITEEDLYTYENPIIAYKKLIQFFNKYINKYSTLDKFIPCAYNGRFDLDFMHQFFIKNNDKYFGSWQNWQLLDPLVVVRYWMHLKYTVHKKNVPINNYKLESVCKYFDIPLIAHDAMSDIEATRRLHHILCNSFTFTHFVKDEIDNVTKEKPNETVSD